MIKNPNWLQFVIKVSKSTKIKRGNNVTTKVITVLYKILTETTDIQIATIVADELLMYILQMVKEKKLMNLSQKF